MQDIIKILPDNIANQIAAGEVVQRPASVVKELLENSIDAGSTEIDVFIKDAGKTLIQVVDNGKGMSFTDARLCFEKHATSKISEIDDLYKIETMGFRGEAMASIASVARIDLKTKTEEEKLGTHIKIEGSEVKHHDHIASEGGTSIAVESIFFNTPARRNFFKSDRAEFQQIQETFTRVSLAYPQIRFSLSHNDKPVFQLHEKSTFQERIAALFGAKIINKLIAVGEETDIVKIDGWVSKPDALLKSKSHQYFFLNDRFIINPYLRHAVINAFNDASDGTAKPSFFINLNINPSDFDINVHPTKTEAKFKNEREIYSILSVAVRGAVSKHVISPMIDFENIKAIDLLTKNKPSTPQKSAVPPVSPRTYNPFEPSHSGINKKMRQGWDKIYEAPKTIESHNQLLESGNAVNLRLYPEIPIKNLVLFQTEQGLIVLHPKRAESAISQQRFIIQWKEKSVVSENLILEMRVEIDPQKVQMVEKEQEVLKKMGFGMKIDKETMLVRSVPYFMKDIDEGALEQLIDKMIDLLVLEFATESELYKFVFEEVKPLLKTEMLFCPKDVYETYETFVQLVKDGAVSPKNILNIIETETIETLLL